MGVGWYVVKCPRFMVQNAKECLEIPELILTTLGRNLSNNDGPQFSSRETLLHAQSPRSSSTRALVMTSSFPTIGPLPVPPAVIARTQRCRGRAVCCDLLCNYLVELVHEACRRVRIEHGVVLGCAGVQVPRLALSDTAKSLPPPYVHTLRHGMGQGV